MGGGGLPEKRNHPHETEVLVSESSSVHGHLKTDEKAVSSARGPRLEGLPLPWRSWRSAQRQGEWLIQAWLAYPRG